MSNQDIPTINITARAPFHSYFEGPALSLSGRNKVGPFDILPGHADFFSVLTPCTITIQTIDHDITFAITTGIITVQNDDVKLFVNM